MLRVAIVDDEVHARTAIRILLERCSEVEVVAECGNGLEAVLVLQWLTVDVLLLDVQMPGLDGFGVIQSVGADRMPPTVFVTAFDTYAVRAFEVEALDYVLKPFDEARFFAAFNRVCRRVHDRRSVEWARRLVSRFGGASPLPRPHAKLPIPVGDRVLFVDVQEIDWIQASNQYVLVHVGGREYLLRESLHRLAERLPGDRFARIHRSHLINVSRVREMAHLDKGDAEVTLMGGRRLRVSRRYRDRLRALLPDRRRG